MGRDGRGKGSGTERWRCGFLFFILPFSGSPGLSYKGCSLLVPAGFLRIAIRGWRSLLVFLSFSSFVLCVFGAVQDTITPPAWPRCGRSGEPALCLPTALSSVSYRDRVMPILDRHNEYGLGVFWGKGVFKVDDFEDDGGNAKKMGYSCAGTSYLGFLLWELGELSYGRRLENRKTTMKCYCFPYAVSQVSECHERPLTKLATSQNL